MARSRSPRQGQPRPRPPASLLGPMPPAEPPPPRLLGPRPPAGPPPASLLGPMPPAGPPPPRLLGPRPPSEAPPAPQRYVGVMRSWHQQAKCGIVWCPELNQAFFARQDLQPWAARSVRVVVGDWLSFAILPDTSGMSTACVDFQLLRQGRSRPDVFAWPAPDWSDWRGCDKLDRRVKWAPVDQLKYSQNTISPVFGVGTAHEGEPLAHLIHDLWRNTVSTSTPNLILDVIKVGDLLYSLNNRRLFALKAFQNLQRSTPVIARYRLLGAFPGMREARILRRGLLNNLSTTNFGEWVSTNYSEVIIVLTSKAKRTTSHNQSFKQHKNISVNYRV